MIKQTILYLSMLVLFACNSTKKPHYTKVIYPAWGTNCEIIYENNDELDIINQIDSIFKVLSKSCSNYDTTSQLWAINANKSLILDEHLVNLFNLSKDFYQLSNGAFDPSVYPIVKHWGFMNKKGEWKDTSILGAMLKDVGLKQWEWSEGEITHKPINAKVDFNAIAPGYAADVIASFLDRQGIVNYYINNGGELVLKGKNQENLDWGIGINNPLNPDNADTMYRISNMAMATSGNYRNYFEKDGKKYGHTISPFTGMPISTDVLSATVLADKAAKADALATICMTLSSEQAIAFLQKNNYKGYIIFLSTEGKISRKLLN